MLRAPILRNFSNPLFNFSKYQKGPLRLGVPTPVHNVNIRSHLVASSVINVCFTGIELYLHSCMGQSLLGYSIKSQILVGPIYIRKSTINVILIAPTSFDKLGIIILREIASNMEVEEA